MYGANECVRSKGKTQTNGNGMWYMYQFHGTMKKHLEIDGHCVMHGIGFSFPSFALEILVGIFCAPLHDLHCLRKHLKCDKMTSIQSTLSLSLPCSAVCSLDFPPFFCSHVYTLHELNNVWLFNSMEHAYASEWNRM